MMQDFIGHEIRDGDKLYIIAGNLNRVPAYRDGDLVIPIDESKSYMAQTLKDGKNSRVDLRLSWLENYMRQKGV